MNILIESSKSFQEVVFDFEPAAQRLGLTVLARHDLGEALVRRESGGSPGFDEDYLIFEVISWPLAEAMLAVDLRSGLILPWRFVVFTDNGATRLGYQQALLPDAPAVLGRLIAEVEGKLGQLLDEMR